MSDTPETDAHEYEFVNHDDCAGETLRRCHDGHDVSWDDNYNGPAVPSARARKLERELYEARKLAKQYRDQLADRSLLPLPWENA